jgi:hypothetical protein
MKPVRFTSLAIALALGAALFAQSAVNPDAKLVQEFQERVAQYMRFRKTLESKLPALTPTDAPATIKVRQLELARGIREARASAKQGDIFSPKIAAEFRRLIGFAMQPQDRARVKGSLQSAEPVKLRVRVGDAYPDGIPLQSTPPTLLLNLPALPQDIDYRVVDHTLVLRDVKANLILDYIPSAIP